MNKKLIATAMGLILAGGMGLASADVKLYGQIDLSLDATDSDTDIGDLNGTAAGYSDDVNMNSNQSALGIKGSEDLGNGMSAFFKLEYQTDPTEGSDLTGRDQYIGIKMERFGKITFGATSTAYKSPGSKIDAFYRTSLQSRGIGLQSNLHSGKGEEGHGRGTNIARYDSPSWKGVSFTGTYQFDNDKQNNAEDDDPYSLGLQYKGGNLYAAASYIDTQQNDDADAAQFLAKYTWNAFSFHGIYEMDGGLITAQGNNGIGDTVNGRDGTADDDGADIFSLGATYTIGNNLIGADYGHREDSDGTDGVANTGDDLEEYDVWRIAAYHKFSNRTRVYAGYANNDYDEKGEDDIFSLGMRHSF